MNKILTEISLMKRNNYFSGKLLSADDFNEEQTYFRTKMRLHNQMLLSCGFVSGLRVSASKNQPESIIVHAGLAIDPQGNEIIVPFDVECPVPQNSEMTYLVVYWAERETDFIPFPGVESEGNQTVPSRVEEYALLMYEENPEEANRSGIVLAHLRKVRGKWRIDEKFRVHNVKVK